MSYSLSDGPSAQPSVIEIADLWEVECLKKADLSISIMDIGKSLGIIEDTMEEDDEIEDFELEGKLQEVTDEIERRITTCRGNYPFKLLNRGYVLTPNFTVVDECVWSYLFLLLATRNNMSGNKIKVGIDGTEVFEKLSKDILINYLGEHSDGLVFGTASETKFRDNLDDLVVQLNEGALHPENRTLTFTPKDSTLDVVAWISFRDNLPSKLICFAQCKTGTSWQDDINQLNVNDFLMKWFSRSPKLIPINAFMIADILNTNDFYYKCGTNLFFDRCRITNFFAMGDPSDWFDDLITWTQGIMKQFNLSFNTTA